MFKLHADKVKLDCTEKEIVTSGSVGVNKCQFTFGPEWDDMNKVIVFRAGSVKKSVALDISNTCKIPWEVLEQKGNKLEVGVCGTKGEDLALPTVWATLGTVLEGATIGDPSQPPTPDIYETILEAANSAMNAAKSVREDADSGAFDGKAATIKVGETITGQPNTPEKVENIGTESEALLRFTLPGGLTGPTGATPQISVEVIGLPEESEPTVQVSGTPEHPIITLGIPAGKTGSPGEPGTPGKNGDPGSPGTPGQTPNIEIGTVETLPEGESVTASITGQTPNLTLNLGIPVGRAGAKGTDGVSPEVAIQSTETGTRVTITDKDGPKSFDVLNGKDGDPGKNGDPGKDGEAATIAITETETVSPDTPAAMVEIPGSTPQARLYKAQVPQGPAGEGVPPTDGVPESYVLTPAGWAEPPTGGEKPWTTIIDETSPEGGVFGFSANGLNNITEFFIYAYFPQVEQVVPFCVAVNGTRILQDNVGVMSTSKEQYAVYHFIFDGEAWTSFRGTGVNNAGVTYYSNSLVTRWPQPTEGPATEIQVSCNGSPQVFIAGATIKVRGR